MSTRCNIVFGDHDQLIWFYRHSDGYPDGPVPEDLDWMQKKCEEGVFRCNASQTSGWLIIKGYQNQKEQSEKMEFDLSGGWKVGDYEPTSSVHGDINFLYAVKFKNEDWWKNSGSMEWKCFSVDYPMNSKKLIEEVKEYMNE